MTVELCSLEISVKVWKSLSCRAVGLSNLSAACFKRAEAWYSPSAAMIFALRSRSAWAWPAIERCIPWGISTSLTSTTLTFTPHGSVCWSIMVCSSSFISSRLVRRLSRSFWPRTLLRVVWLIWLVARTWFSTSMTLLFGSTTLKYTTALTLAGTLSRVITSWGGTSMVTVLRSILTMLSMNGSRMKSPGPLGPPCTRPRRKITPRSYSVTILIALSKTETTNTAITARAMNPMPKPNACNKPKFSYIRDPPLVLALRVHRPVVVGPLRGHHLHRTSLAEAHHGNLAPHPYKRLAVSRVGHLRGERQHGPPPFAVHEHPPRGFRPHGAPDGADLADHPILAGEGTPPPEGARRAQNPEEQATQERRDGHDCAEQHARVGDPCPQQRKSPGEHHDDAQRGRKAVVGRDEVHDQHRDPEEDQERPDRRRYHHRRGAVRFGAREV